MTPGNAAATSTFNALNADRIAWEFGDAAIDVEGAVGKPPGQWGMAAGTGLYKHKGGEPLPKASIAADSARGILAPLFPKLEIDILTRKEFRQYVQPGQPARAFIGSGGGTDVLVCESSDGKGRYVDGGLLLRMLGEYVLTDLNDLWFCRDPKRIAGFDDVVESMRLKLPCPACEAGAEDATCFHAAFALAYFLNLDPRLVSFCVFKQALKDEVLNEYYSVLAIHLRNVIDSERALAAYLLEHTGLTREEFRACTPERRKHMVANATATLAKCYQGSGGNGMGQCSKRETGALAH